MLGDDKGNGVAGNMMSINNISILVVGGIGYHENAYVGYFQEVRCHGLEPLSED